MVSATDLTFLWEDCRRCFYRKVVLGEPRPRAPFPMVFGQIDRAMKTRCAGRRLEDIAPGAPIGVVAETDRWVCSSPLVVGEGADTLVIRGRLDALVACDHGATGIIDFKTSDPHAPNLDLYGRQLHAYASALEHPAAGPVVSVSVLGLLCFSPERFDVDHGRGALGGALTWVKVPRDEAAFGIFLSTVASAIGGNKPPEASRTCGWCRATETQRWGRGQGRLQAQR